MKLVIDVPEWAQERRIAVFAGVEMLAEYNPLKDKDHIFIKVDRCSQCGDCCRGVNLNHTPLLKSIKGQCIFLAEEPGFNGEKWYCTIASNRPLSCMYDPNKINEPRCTITYRKEPIIK